ncbi:hypothetical protein MOQ58_16190 [Pseudomonas migulae]|uniref:Uncharacterized protein n=1 Tax=Pseudomonas migulae TaxID=78543 RepID=A0ABY8N1I7_9PSED|nr:hypothetical protein [Pseudomonas migulae]WGK93557.1 hypothetical protein MOQ58_16190 [Pseudomonas migulae]
MVAELVNEVAGMKKEADASFLMPERLRSCGFLAGQILEFFKTTTLLVQQAILTLAG